MAESNTQNLPTIIRREVLYPKLNQKDAMPEREKTTIKIISLLRVNFKDEEDQIASIAEFGSMLRDYPLTSEEVIEAYKMALRRELSDEKGDVIELYPMLCLITLGKVVKSYIRYKRDNPEWVRGKKMLEEMIAPKPKELTQKEKDVIVINGLIDEFESFKKTGVIQGGRTYLYSFLYKKGMLPVHTSEFREAIQERAKEELRKEKLSNFDNAFREFVKNVEQGKEKPVVKCKEIILRDYFNSLIEKGIDIREEINQK